MEYFILRRPFCRIVGSITSPIFIVLGGKGNVKAENIGLGNIKYSPTVPSSTIPPCDVVCDAISRFKYPAIEKEV